MNKPIIDTLEIEYSDTLNITGCLIEHAYRWESKARESADNEHSSPAFQKLSRKRADEALRALNAFRAATDQEPLTADWLMQR